MTQSHFWVTGLKFCNLSHLHLTSMSYDHVMPTLVGFRKGLSSLKIPKGEKQDGSRVKSLSHC
jgi:hypothetical protein